MSEPRILVAGIGNIFLGDDAFGVEVVRRLACREQLPGVRVVDFGIRGLDLTYALLDGYDAAVLVDALPRGGEPGTLYVVEPEIDETEAAAVAVDGHGMDPVKVLRLVRAMGGNVERIVIVGCEPSPGDDFEEMQLEMSAPVRNALDRAVCKVEEVVSLLLQSMTAVSS
jgi:hydrogenase maturation protease